MSQQTIGERIKFFMDAENMGIRKLARALDVSDTNIRNYLDRGTKPSSDVVEKILRTFPRINPVWFVLGEGEPFLSETNGMTARIDARKNKGFVIGNNHESPIHHRLNAEYDALLKENEQLKEQLAMKNNLLQMQEALLAAKEETLALLRGSQNRPN